MAAFRVGAAVCAWLALALFVGVNGLLARAPWPPPAIALGLAVVTLLVLRTTGAARQAVWSVGLRPLVAFHLTRVLAGAYFLVLYRRGLLPGEFAVPAGWGDIVVGAAAILVLTRCLPVRTQGQRLALLAWNTAGLADILLVLANGSRILQGDATARALFATLPLAVLPLFVIPLVIVSHLLLFGWTPRRIG